MKTRILIVDDDIGGAQLMKMRLEVDGRYHVRTVHCGAGALPAARQFRPHVILLDVQMPDQDGGDVAAQIRADASFQMTPIVFVTSLVSAEDCREGELVRGGFPFLSKAVTTSQLIALVEEELARMHSGAVAVTV